MQRLVIAVLGVVAACGAQAQMYKWVDENGRVQYTQTPPPPGRQAQQIKPPATQTGPRPEPAGKSAGAPAPDGGRKPAGKGTAKPGGKDEISADARRMLGEWRTHPGARVQVKFALHQDGSTLRSGQAWSVGADSHASSGMKVDVSGENGAGAVMQDTSDKLPSTLGYELRGNGLILTVGSGPFAGTHLLTRNR
jgi:hypothetical protein